VERYNSNGDTNIATIAHNQTIATAAIPIPTLLAS
jgi:hypothetical protein